MDAAAPVTSKPSGPPLILVPPVMVSAVAAMLEESSMAIPATVALTTLTPLTVLLLAAPAPNCGSLLVARMPYWLPVRVPPDTITLPVDVIFHSRTPYTVPVTLLLVAITPTALPMDDSSRPKLV